MLPCNCRPIIITIDISLQFFAVTSVVFMDDIHGIDVQWEISWYINNVKVMYASDAVACCNLFMYLL